MGSSITDHKVEFRDLTTNAMIPSGTGVLTDNVGNPGTFIVMFTPTLAGKFKMHIEFNGLDVDASPYDVTVSPAATTNAAASTIININSKVFSTGETLAFVIESRDAYSNLRTTSTSDVYVVTLTGDTSGTVWTATTPTANNNGTYTAAFKFTIAETYTLKVRFGGVDLKDTPITGF